MTNIDTVLINYQETLKKEYDLLKPISEKYASDIPVVNKSWSTINKLYNEKLSTLRPQIMVYGIYNAGKSSIINALIRSNKAKVADRPMTDSIDFYEWNGYQIADTPGVGAPIRHEEVTNEYLKQADVVLFVMSTSGAFDYAQNYVRMKDIIDAGKRVIIILNDKQGYDNDAEELHEIKQKIIKNMLEVGLESGLSADAIREKYIIEVVNAADAKDALESNSKALWINSGIPKLEKIINSELKKANSILVLKNTLSALEVEVKRIIDGLSGQEDGEGLNELNEVLTQLREQRTKLRLTMKDYIEIQTDKMCKALASKIWTVKEDQSKIEKVVSDEVEALSGRVQNHLEVEFDEVKESLAKDLSKLIVKLDKMKIEIKPSITVNPENVEMPNVPDGAYKPSMADVLIKAMEIYEKLQPKKVPLPAPLSLPHIPTLPKSPIGDVLTSVGKTYIADSVAKGVLGNVAKGALTGTVLSKFIPYVGPAIEVLKLFNKIFGGPSPEELAAEAAARNEYEKRRLAAEEEARLTLKQSCETMGDEIIDSLRIAVNDLIKQSLSKIEEELTQQKIASNQSSEMLASDVAQLSAIDNRLSMLFTKLN